jgi:3-mercaptopyruvate sulfurtransferase SseA
MRFNMETLLVIVLALAVFTACQNASTTGSTASNTQNAAGSKTTPTVAANNQPKTPTAPQVDEHGHEDNAPRINLAEAKKEFDAGNAVFVDTRAESAFKQERIKGAINIPADQFEARYKQIPTGKKIIAYCS